MASQTPSEATVPAELRPRRVIGILGMHRSGTSCLAGSLEQQGLYLGEVNTAAPFNRRGNRESFAIMGLQGDVLEKSGGSWDVPPSLVEWQPEHVDRAREILAEQAGRPVWGFKDPRTLLTLEGWQRLVPDLQPVGIFRHPLRVAHSLQNRNQFELETGVALWRTYNERLLQLHERAPFPIVDFDEEPEVLQEKLLKAGEMVGLERAETDEPFFTDELRNAPAEGEPIPAEVEVLYAELRRLAV